MTATLLAPAAAAADVSPYRGLEPYGENDWQLFFGRERECEIIAANLTASRLTLLYGPSGIGKTSVLRAGVAHHLMEGAQQNRADFGSPEHAVVVFNDWRDDPAVALPRAIASAAAEALGEPLTNLPAGLDALSDVLNVWATRLDGTVLVILDQFEEYFLYHGLEEGPGTFAHEFPRAVNRRDLRANFLVSVREDALAKLDRFKSSLPELFTNYLRLDYLKRQDAAHAIEKPLDHYNELHRDRTRVDIEPELTRAVLNEVRTDADQGSETGRGVLRRSDGSGGIDASYLQVVMRRLWDEETRAGSNLLRLRTFERLGTARTILQTHLDATMNQLTADEREVAVGVFNFLVTPSGMKIALSAEDLASYAQLDRDRIEAVLERLSGHQDRVLSPVGSYGPRATQRYQIYHDRLADAILSWRTRYVAESKLREEREWAQAQLAAALAEQERQAVSLAASERARAAGRLVLPIAWALLFWLVAPLGFFVAYALASYIENTSANTVLVVISCVLGLFAAGGVITLMVRRRATRLGVRTLLMVAGCWILMGGIFGGSIIGVLLSVPPEWAINKFPAGSPLLPVAPLLVALGMCFAVVAALLVNAYGAAWLTARLVDRAGGFGVPQQGTNLDGVRYVGFWSRMLSKLIDDAIVLTLTIVASAGFVALRGPGIGSTATGAAIFLAFIVVPWLYEATMVSTVGRTLGKMAIGAYVRGDDGRRLSFLDASLRHVSKYLSTLLLLAGFVAVAFDRRKQGWHDHLAQTVVVKRAG